MLVLSKINVKNALALPQIITQIYVLIILHIIIIYHICDGAQVWGKPETSEHTKNASYRGGQAAN